MAINLDKTWVDLFMKKEGGGCKLKHFENELTPVFSYCWIPHYKFILFSIWSRKDFTCIFLLYVNIFVLYFLHVETF